ncbi:MAG TPA: Lrp/AsnC ligand binding domain-containing protein [Gaiellaceae bacterium]|nr:Lrp/AsnC ligand binding domain-containing protein [Gaiellaceae bacterium]
MSDYELTAPRVWAYVFVDTENPGPRRVCQEVRKLPGVVRADALLGTPDVVAIVAGIDVAELDAVIDRIVEIDGVVDSETKVARWIE